MQLEAMILDRAWRKSIDDSKQNDSRVAMVVSYVIIILSYYSFLCSAQPSNDMPRRARLNLIFSHFLYLDLIMNIDSNMCWNLTTWCLRITARNLRRLLPISPRKCSYNLLHKFYNILTVIAVAFGDLEPDT